MSKNVFDAICQKRGVPNIQKEMKARDRRPSAFICFEVFGIRDEARSPKPELIDMSSQMNQ